MKRTPLKRKTRLRSKRPDSPKVERITLSIPRPSEVIKVQVAVRVMKDGREVCNLLIKAGRDEYERRKRVMWERQKGLCCLCKQRLTLADMSFEHQDGRGHGGGHRDDRIEKDGKPYNGVAHGRCNTLKGSQRIDYNEVP